MPRLPQSIPTTLNSPAPYLEVGRGREVGRDNALIYKVAPYLPHLPYLFSHVRARLRATGRFGWVEGTQRTFQKVR